MPPFAYTYRLILDLTAKILRLLSVLSAKYLLKQLAFDDSQNIVIFDE